MLGVSVLCSILFSSFKFFFTDDCSGIKNKEYNTITAVDKDIAAITFLESKIISHPFFQLDHAHHDQSKDYIL